MYFLNVIHPFLSPPQYEEDISQIMSQLLVSHSVPLVQQMRLLTRLRLANSFSQFETRVKCVLVRLQAVSVLGQLIMCNTCNCTYMYMYLILIMIVNLVYTHCHMHFLPLSPSLSLSLPLSPSLSLPLPLQYIQWHLLKWLILLFMMD